MAFLELVTLLPPGAPSQTRLARHGQRLVVLRELKEGTACFYPQPGPRLITLEEVGELQGKRHALFAYLPGVTLRDLADAFEELGKPVPLGLAGAMVLQAARALAAVEPPRPHGGLSDAALHVSFSGETHVLDFGAPRITRYKALGRESLPADVFALGGALHAVLTRYQGPYVNPPEALPRPSAVHPEASAALDEVVLKALSPQLPARHANVGVFADALEAVLGASYSAADLAAVVSSLFSDRIKLLASLSGLMEMDAAPAPSLGVDVEESRTASHQVLQPGPLPGIPMGTEPGSMGEGTNPGARVSWTRDEVSEEVPAYAVEDGGTQPRIEVPVAREENTNPGAPPPAPPPRLTAADARRQSPVSASPSAPVDAASSRTIALGDFLDAEEAPDRADETDAGQRKPRPSAANLKALDHSPAAEPRSSRPSAAKLRPLTDDAGGEPRPSRPSTPNPRAPVAEARPSAPSPRGIPEGTEPGYRGPSYGGMTVPLDVAAAALEAPPEVAPPRAPRPPPEDTSPRAPRPAPEDTSPRAPRPPPEDTSPRASQPRIEDTNPRAPQPLSVPGVDETAPRARVPVDPGPRNTTSHERLRAKGQERVATPPLGMPALGEEIAVMPTAVRQRPVAPPEDEERHDGTLEEQQADGDGRRGGRGLIAVLLLVIVGLAAAWGMKQGRIPAPGPLADLLGVAAEADAGVAEDAADDAGTDAPDGGDATAVGATSSEDGGVLTTAGLIDDGGQALDPTLDGGAVDGGAVDGGAVDGGAVDGGAVDGGAVDGGDVVPSGLDAGAKADAATEPSSVKTPPKKKKRRHR